MLDPAPGCLPEARPSSQPTTDDASSLVRFTRPAQMPGLELVCYPKLSRGWQGIPEAYTWFTMIPWLEGDVQVISRGVSAQCEVGSVTVGQPGEPYALRPRSAMRGEFRVIRVDNAVLDAIVEEVGGRGGDDLFPREPVCNPELAWLFARSYAAIAHAEKLEAQEHLHGFIASLLGIGTRAGAPRRAGNAPNIRRARESLHAHFDASVSLDELALAAGMGKFALLRAFSQQLGMTPHAYQVQLRMARACRLIAQQMPLSEVALAVGYSEQSALQRAFRQRIGVTPGAYGRALR